MTSHPFKAREAGDFILLNLISENKSRQIISNLRHSKHPGQGQSDEQRCTCRCLPAQTQSHGWIISESAFEFRTRSRAEPTSSATPASPCSELRLRKHRLQPLRQASGNARLSIRGFFANQPESLLLPWTHHEQVPEPLSLQ